MWVLCKCNHQCNEGRECPHRKGMNVKERIKSENPPRKFFVTAIIEDPRWMTPRILKVTCEVANSWDAMDAVLKRLCQLEDMTEQDVMDRFDMLAMSVIKE